MCAEGLGRSAEVLLYKHMEHLPYLLAVRVGYMDVIRACEDMSKPALVDV